ncbi:hypothetical protein IMX26_17080 [Clostridium sp. 'deep sea']|uniref:DUF6612 family protein n=1 Tax=Clostridium sp. 'deep sea' TaxID=2779445 RepID=UPI00189643D1|nr:DUF6612 family protein [Clostridium sp. 'deep sea']QOR35148.1 hypothetical protein IMX26_17080 [Clostridium sp. 'deep sea']
MKKLKIVFLTIIVFVTIAGCVGTNKELTAQDILQDVFNKTQKLKSFRVNISDEQENYLDNFKSTNSINIIMEINKQQPAIHQLIKDLRADNEVELYISENDYYVKCANTEFAKINNYDFNKKYQEFLTLSFGFLDQIAEYSDNLILVNEENSYIVKLDATSKDFADLQKEYQNQIILPSMKGIEPFLKLNKVNSFVYELTIDQETHTVQQAVVDMDIELTAKKMALKIKNKVSYEFSDYNNVSKIDIQQSIK